MTQRQIQSKTTRKINFPGALLVVLFFISIMALISIWRGLWVWQLRDLMPENSAGLVFQAFWVGLRLDLVVATVLTIPVFIVAFIPTSTSRNWGWCLAKIWFAVSGILVGICMIVDMEFFREFDSHLNLMVTQYLGQSELWQFLWATYPMIRYPLLMIGVTGMFWLGFTHFLGKLPRQTARPKWLPIPAFLVLAVLLVIAGRGGVQERPVNWGNAIFSKNHFANQTALNPLFFFGRNISQLADTRNLSRTLSYFPLDSARAIANELRQPMAVTLSDVKTDSFRPHVVLVVLETFVGEYCGYLNPVYTDVTPNLDAIAKAGISFRRCYANGTRTAHGLGAILCSWPNLPGAPIIYRVEAQHNMPTAASILSDDGYQTTFLYGGDSGFDNMSGFFIANGFDQILDKSVFPRDTPATMWGVYDEYLFNKTLEILDSARAPQFLTVLTVSNHQPWTLPAHREAQIPVYSSDATHPRPEMLRTMQYVDASIGEFLASAKGHTWFDSTLFVFVSDHGHSLHPNEYYDPRNHRIVGLFYGPKLLGEPRVINMVTSQVDILPTLLGALQKKSNINLWGQNRLIPGRGHAEMYRNNRFDWFEDDYFYEETLGATAHLYRYSDDWNLQVDDVTETEPERFARLQRQARAYLQTAYFNFADRLIPAKNRE